MSRALIAVDVQADFMPGGALAVPDGDQVVEPILAADFDYLVVTGDAHPTDHCSFDSQGGDWPAHCVVGTPGCVIDPRLFAAADLVVWKGGDPAREQYSSFDGPVRYSGFPRGAVRTGLLADQLFAHGVTDVVVAGLATEICVGATAAGARAEGGFAVSVLAEGCRGLDALAHARTIEEWS